MVLWSDKETAMSKDHGRFIWYELMTSDVPAAKRFYGHLVGWTFDDMPAGDATYTVVKAGDDGVGGMMTFPPPSHWSGYVCVDDADAAASKIKSLGGSVIHEPADIPGVGRFAVVADPHGAVFEIMTPAPMETPRPRPPAGTLGQASWHELFAGDGATAFDFYREMFGWRKDEAMDMGPMGVYQLFSNQDGQVGGMMNKPAQMPQPAWLYYFQVDDIDAAVARATEGGAQVINGPMEVPGGAWVYQAMDPQGAMFAVVGRRG
jgi:predicted enzyme related to lactoylglutathione lyase